MNSIKFIFVKFQLKIIKYLWSHWINTYSIEIIIIHHLQPNLFDGNKSFEFSDRGAVLLLILFLSFAFEMLVARHWMAVTWSISDNHKSLSLWIFAHVLSTRVVTPAQHLTSTILLPLAISYKYKVRNHRILDIRFPNRQAQAQSQFQIKTRLSLRLQILTQGKVR